MVHFTGSSQVPEEPKTFVLSRFQRAWDLKGDFLITEPFLRVSFQDEDRCGRGLLGGDASHICS